MRIVVSSLIVAAGIAAATNAYAADLSFVAPAYESALVRTSQIMFYDNDPGVVTRAYWLAPWGGRHYFPSNGKKPKVGRRENLTLRYPRPEPAETYFRYWSTQPAVVSERPRPHVPALDPDDDVPLPPLK
jgi:hypothetical protein